MRSAGRTSGPSSEVFHGGGAVLLTRKMDVCTALYNVISASLLTKYMWSVMVVCLLEAGYGLDWMEVKLGASSFVWSYY
jgi:hypothetical protein